MRARKKLKPALSIFGSGSSSSKPYVGQKGKKYGLVKPSKQKLSIFSMDDDDDEEEEKPVDYNLLKYRKKMVKRQREEALAEDPTVFQYDEVLDDIQQKRDDKAKAVKAEKRARKSRYIENLLKKAKEREIEQAIIEERVLLKERKENDHMFGDKDKYVTSGYKKALKERKMWIKERDRLDAIDEARAKDRAKGGMHSGGFMRNILSSASNRGKEEEEIQTIRERVNKELDEREKREKEERERRKAEERKKKEKTRKEKSLEDVAREAVMRYDNIEDASKETEKVVKAVKQSSKADEKAEEKPAPQTKEQVIEKRNTGDKLMSAKERYLARKRAKAKLAEKLGK